MKHKHAELIKQWADGAEIQEYYMYSNIWFDVEKPTWNPEKVYRVKPNSIEISR